MVCEKCGHEYYGFECPNCAFHNDMIEQEENEQKSPEYTASEKGSSFAEKRSGTGVHSDTIHAPQGSEIPQSPDLENPQGDLQHCPVCGTEIGMNTYFCGYCGTAIYADAYRGNTYTGNQYSQNGFTEKYLREKNNDMTGIYHRKMKPGMVILVILLILLLEVLPLVLSFSFMLNENEIFSELESKFSYGENEEDFDYGNEESETILPEVDTDSDMTETEGVFYPNGVSVEEYQQLQVGMTYGEISYIIGGDAQAQDLDNAAENELIAIWPGENKLSAMVRITFVDGVATEIEQDGLF